MRALAALSLLFSLACVHPPQEGSKEWVVQKYSEAVLKADEASAQKYTSEQAQTPALPEALRAAGLTVLRLCPLSENEAGTSYTAVALLGQKLHGALFGLQVTAQKAKTDWQVSQAIFPVNEDGRPHLYLPDCDDDPGGNKSVGPAKPNQISRPPRHHAQ